MLNKICQLCYDIVLSKGFSECVYQECICLLLRENNIKYEKETILPIIYHDICIGNVRTDIIIHTKTTKIILEIKAIDANLTKKNIPQIIVYMNLLNISNGLLINFCQNPVNDLIEIIMMEKIDNLYKAKFLKNNEILSFNNLGQIIPIKN